MEKQMIRSALIDLIRQGRLSAQGDNIMFDGEPVSAAEKADVAEYRADGYSNETSHGCRRHRAVDEFVAQLKEGDEFQQEVAKDADIWFGFHLDHAPQLKADDPDEVDEVMQSYANSKHLVYWLAPQKDMCFNFRLPAEDYDEYESTHYWFMPKNHGVIFPQDPKTEVADRWPNQYIEGLKSQVAGLKRRAGLDWP